MAALGTGCGATHMRQDILCRACRTDTNLLPTFPGAETALVYPGLGEEYSGSWSVQGRCACPSALESTCVSGGGSEPGLNSPREG